LEPMCNFKTGEVKQHVLSHRHGKIYTIILKRKVNPPVSVNFNFIIGCLGDGPMNLYNQQE